MTREMSAAEIAATRHLMGLSQVELADALSVSRHTVKDWETGRLVARAGVARDLQGLRAEHDAEAGRLVGAAEAGVPIELGRAPRPAGWYLALGARILAAVPDARLEWQ